MVKESSPESTNLTLGGSNETWNFAEGFTKIKILRILIALDLYETVALFGYNDIDDVNHTDPRIIPYKRVEALHRVLFSIRQLIGNCKFSISDIKDKQIVSLSLVRLEQVEKVIDGIANEVTNDVTKENSLIINEEHFRRCFDILRNIKDEINFVLNRAGLIFRQNESVDLDKIMSDIIEGG